MVRGRSIDKTLQPSRSLTIQRDYRARKAARQKSLEDAVERLTSENMALRAEVAELRAARAQEAPTALLPTHVAAIGDVRARLSEALGQLDSLYEAIWTPVKQPSHSGRCDAQPTQPAPEATSCGGGIDDARCHINGTCKKRAASPMTKDRHTRSSTSTDPAAYAYARALSRSPSAEPGSPGRAALPAPFDPQCCDGVMDCSGLTTLQTSDLRTGG